MKKILFLCMILLCSIKVIFAQTYRNEWIDFTKTYYKFTLSVDGVYRIFGSNLPTNIAGSKVQDFKLWRNGVEIPIFTSVQTGQLGTSDYIEFWGQKNDGKADTEMYLDSTYQTNDMVSLETDNASYFLTASTGTTNARFTSPFNDLSNVGIAKTYFMDTIAVGLRNQLWAGEAQYISNQYVRSSSYDKNEGWTSNVFTATSFPLSNLKVYTQSDAPKMRFTHSGGGAFIGVRNISTYLNDSLIDVRSNAYFDNYLSDVKQIPLSRVIGDAITVRLQTSDASQYGTILLSKYKLVYPRKFDFGGQQSFAFDLPADLLGTYLEISNFNGGTNPVLIDLTNNRRYICAINNGLIKVKMQPSMGVQKCVLYSSDPAFATSITSFTSRNFNDYSQIINQSDFMFIANSVLNSGGANNQVEAYRSYRASAIGGGYNAKIYDVDELTDQFAYGIRKHPMAVHNFLQYARAKFVATPKFVLLVGHGVDYSSFYYNQNDVNADVLNMVPTWGYPASDILLSAASKKNPIAATPIGRISVVNSVELKNYLQKIKEYDIVHNDTTNTQANQGWKKNVALLIGAGDDVGPTITGYMAKYQSIIQDTFTGAHAPIYTQYKNPNIQQTVSDLSNEINNGVSLLDYFGHSSTTALQFNLDNPNNYTNTNGKYPVFSISGCDAGDFFQYNTTRITNSIYTISEQFIVAQERGAIATLASTHFGVVNALDNFNTQFIIAASISSYGKSLGETLQKANDSTWRIFNGDYFTRLTLEENTINGDPSVKMFFASKPDFSMEPQNINISPALITVANDSFTVAMSIHNIGKATNDSVTVQVQRQYPNGSIKTIGSYKLKRVPNSDSLTFKVPIVGDVEKGTNYIIVTLDPANLVNEVSETNNTASLSFNISADQIRPVYPYQFSIVNKTSFKLVATTVDPFQQSRTYQVQMDTTELFNSPLLASSQITQVGGEVEFTPPISNLVDGNVYYWRVAPIISGNLVNSQTSSFLYSPNSGFGWNQSHLYQHFKSTLSHIVLDSTSRKFGFSNLYNSVQVNHAYYFGDGVNGGVEANDFGTFINGTLQNFSDCASPSILFLVFDNVHFRPWYNYPGGLYGTALNNCTTVGTQNNFQFRIAAGTTQRKTIMDFMNLIPDGYYVVAKLVPYPYPNDSWDSSYTANWWKDTLTYGKAQSLPNYFMNQGFADISQETYPRFWTFIYKKNDSTHFKPVSKFSQSLYDKTSISVSCAVPDTAGYITSPVFGPAKQWQLVHWRGHSLETTSPYPDSAILQVIGINAVGIETVLYNLNRTQLDFDISGISAASYPNIKLKLLEKDTANATPWQLDQWRLDYQPVPEGALAPNLYSTSSDVVSNPLTKYHFGIAFKNISDIAFDSLKLKLKLIDTNGVEKLIQLPKIKKLVAGDTANIYFEIPTDTLNGTYNVYLGVNTDNSQPEQYLFNNFVYKQFTISTILPVTFLSFKATAASSNVALQWQVTNEMGFVFYQVQRSIDGIQFSDIGKVPVNNINALMNTYDMLDKNPVLGKNYYRIKTVDKDGTIDYSEIRTVIFGTANAINVYPNPVKNLLQVNMTSVGKMVGLKLTNATGQQILQKNVFGSTQIDMSKYAAGIYYLQVNDVTGSTVFRINKQ